MVQKSKPLTHSLIKGRNFTVTTSELQRPFPTLFVAHRYFMFHDQWPHSPLSLYRQTDRQTDRGTETDRQTNRETDTGRQRHRGEKERGRDTDRQRETETDRLRQRQ